jgi:hypothetical protein
MLHIGRLSGWDWYFLGLPPNDGEVGALPTSSECEITRALNRVASTLAGGNQPAMSV